VSRKASKAENEETPVAAVSDEHDGKTELFAQGLSFDTTEETLSAFFGKHGELTKCKLLYNKGKAFIEYSDHASARKALEATNQKELDGRTIWVEFSGQAAGGYKPQAGADGEGGEPNTVFVGNLGFRTEQWAIEEFFASCGTISAVRIAQDHETGRSKGFAHVEFADSAMAKKAMEMAGQELDGRAVRLDLSMSKRGGGGGRGGGRASEIEVAEVADSVEAAEVASAEDAEVASAVAVEAVSVAVEVTEVAEAVASVEEEEADQSSREPVKCSEELEVMYLFITRLCFFGCREIDPVESRMPQRI